MTKKEKCISLPLSQELQKVADEFGFELPESEMYWRVSDDFPQAFEPILVDYASNEIRGETFYKAPDTSELGAILPAMIKKDDEFLKFISWFSDNMIYISYDNGREQKVFPIADSSEVNARVKMLIYLISNKLI